MPHDPAILLLGIHPEKNTARKDTCTPMLTEALFTIAKASKQPICPLTGMDKDDVVHICMDYSSIKKKEITPFAVTRMGLETVMPSEVNQRRNMTFLICGI